MRTERARREKERSHSQYRLWLEHGEKNCLKREGEREKRWRSNGDELSTRTVNVSKITTVQFQKYLTLGRLITQKI